MELTRCPHQLSHEKLTRTGDQKLMIKVAGNPVLSRLTNLESELTSLSCATFSTQSVFRVFNNSLSVKLGIFPISCWHWHPIISLLGIHIVQTTSLRERPRLPSYFPSILSTFPIYVSWEPDQSYHVKMAPVVSLRFELVGAKSVFVLCYSRYLSVVGCSQVELSYQ